MRRTLLWIAFVLVTPFAVLGVMLIIGSIFGIAFITSFHVENQTEQSIWITPIGRTHTGGKPTIIPQVMAPFVPLPPLRASNIKVSPGRKVRIDWDMDDHFFTHLVVRSDDGRLYQWEVNPDPEHTERRLGTIVVANLDELDPAMPAIQAALLRDRHGRLWILWLAAVGSIVLMDRLWRRLFPKRKQGDENHEMTPSRQ